MKLTEYFEFFSAPRIAYGPGSIKQIGRIAAALGRTKPLLVIDRVFVDSGLAAEIAKNLEAAGMKPAGTFTDIPPDSGLDVVKKGYDAAIAGGADMIIAVGGGSTIDTAKGIRVMMAEGGTLPEGINVIKQALAPMIAAPTTAGTGSEATTAAVIRDDARGLKIGYTDPALMPSIALLDPELTLTLPGAFTAGTGMDALTHAVESLHSTNRQPLSDALALHAIRLISGSLERAVIKGDDIEARGAMLLAATAAGLAFTNSMVGIVHAAAHACGAAFRVPHGVACGLMLAYGMEFNLEAAADGYAAAAAAMGINTAGMSDRDAAVAAIRRIRDLTRKIGIPQSLKDAGVPEDALDTIIEKTLMDGTMFTNPIQPDEDMLKPFFRKAWLGEEPCADAAETAPAADEAPAAQLPDAAAPADEKKPDKPARPFTVDDMYRVAEKFAKKLFLNPKVTEQLKKSALVIRFIYFNEEWGGKEALLTVDCGADPIGIHLGECEAEPIVTMRMHSETARLFWLQKVNIMSAISKGDITVMGKVNEAMRLLPVIRPGFSLFKDLDSKIQKKDGA